MRLFTYLAVPLLLVFLLIAGWKLVHRRSLRVAEQVQLTATYDRWVEAGRPEGADLDSFLRGRGDDFVVDTGHFRIGQTSYVGILARTNLVSIPGARLVVSTNRVVLLVPNDGAPRVMTMKSLY